MLNKLTSQVTQSKPDSEEYLTKMEEICIDEGKKFAESEEHNPTRNALKQIYHERQSKIGSSTSPLVQKSSGKNKPQKPWKN